MPYNGKLVVGCDFVGFPPPSIVWLKNGVEVVADNLRTFINTTLHDENRHFSNLTIVEFEIEDEGDYSCRVQSSVGIAAADVTVSCECTDAQHLPILVNSRCMNDN